MLPLIPLLLAKVSAYGAAAYSTVKLYKERQRLAELGKREEADSASLVTAEQQAEGKNLFGKGFVPNKAKLQTARQKSAMALHKQWSAGLDFRTKLGAVALTFATLSSLLSAPALGWFSIALLLWGGSFIWKRVFTQLKEEKRLNSDVVLATLSIMCLVSGQVIAASIAIIIASYADRLQLRTEQDTRNKLVNLFDRQVEEVWLVKNGVESKVSIDELQAGDTIAVHTGEMIAVDGLISEGFISVDQHVLTGESQPVEKGLQDEVYASTLVLAGKAYVTVKKMGKETVSAQIADILDNTLHYTQQNVLARSTQFTDKQAAPILGYTAAMFLLGGFYTATSFIIAWSPGRVRVLSSVAMLNHLGVASGDGILIKDGRALEQFHHVDVVVFDKTGTLTDEKPQVGEILAGEGFAESQILAYTAAAEFNLTHPIAHAIVERAREEQITLPDQRALSEYQLGYGIRVRIDGQLVRVGSKRFMEQEGIAIPEFIQQGYARFHEAGNSVIFTALEDELMGIIELRPRIRPETKSVIQSLRDRGVAKIAIVSGDHEEPTRSLAEQLGVDDYVAQALPQDKINYIKTLQSEGKIVCFVGDGVNDSLALKQAHVGISMTGASHIATETAHIVFMKHDLSLMADLAELSKSLNETVSRNMVIASWLPGVAGTGLAVLANASALPVILLGVGCLGLGFANSSKPFTPGEHHKPAIPPSINEN